MTAPRWYRDLMDRCPPLAHTEPDWNSEEAWRGYRRLCRTSVACGIPPHPMQRLFFALMGDPRTETAVVQVGRQQGKTAGEHGWLLDRAIQHPGETEIYSVQDGAEANAKLLKELKPMAEHAGLDESTGSKFHKQAGALFGQHLSNGSYIRTLSSSKHSGRGETKVGAAAADEASTDKDDNRLATISPMTTVAVNGQMVISGTAGDVTSVMFEQQIASALELVGQGPAAGVVLLYWGVALPGEVADVDPDDRAVWRANLPGLGIICDERAIQASKNRMEDWQFAQEFLGQWLRVRADECFPRETWKAISARQQVPIDDPVWLAADCPPTEDRPCAVVVDAQGVVTVAEGCDTIADVDGWLDDWCSRREVRSVSLSERGVLVAAGRRAADKGWPVEWVDLRGLAESCQAWWQAAKASPARTAIQPNPLLTEANGTSMRHELGSGGWLFARRDKTGYSAPLRAAAMGFAAMEADEVGERSFGDSWKAAREKAAAKAGK